MEVTDERNTKEYYRWMSKNFNMFLSSFVFFGDVQEELDDAIDRVKKILA
jgi:hypothetical protein